MKHLAATIAIGPFFFVQGRYVRRVTPVLPEPPGARAATHGNGQRLRLLIVGDSAAVGYQLGPGFRRDDDFRK